MSTVSSVSKANGKAEPSESTQEDRTTDWSSALSILQQVDHDAPNETEGAYYLRKYFESDTSPPNNLWALKTIFSSAPDLTMQAVIDAVPSFAKRSVKLPTLSISFKRLCHRTPQQLEHAKYHGRHIPRLPERQSSAGSGQVPMASATGSSSIIASHEERPPTASSALALESLAEADGRAAPHDGWDIDPPCECPGDGLDCLMCLERCWTEEYGES